MGREKGNIDSDIAVSVSQLGWPPTSPAWSRAGEEVASGGRDGKVRRRVVTTSRAPLVLSPNGKHVGLTVVGRGEQRRTVRDGREGSQRTDGRLPRPIFSPDSRTPGTSGPKSDGKCGVAVADEQKWGPYEELHGPSCSVSDSNARGGMPPDGMEMWYR